MTTPTPPDGDQEVQRPTSRVEVRAILLTFLGFVAGIAFMVLALHQINPDIFDSDAATVMPSVSQGGMDGGAGMSIQEVLNHHIPLDVVGSCTAVPASDLDESMYASARCAPVVDGFKGIEVQYSSLHDKLAMTDMFNAQMTEMQQQMESCDGSDGLSTFTWNAAPTSDEAGTVVHEPKMAHAERVEGTTGGKVMCFVDGGMHQIAWSDNDTHIFAIATAPAERQGTLFTWWEDGAGPYHPRGSMGSPTPSSESPMTESPMSESPSTGSM